MDHILASVEIQKRLGSRDLSLWFADGSNYPGTQNIRHRRHWFEEGLKATHAALAEGQRMLVEYKPFEPAFYHRHRRLGHGPGSGAGCRAQSQSAGGYRPPLSGAEHRADRGLAARHEYVGGIPL